MQADLAPAKKPTPGKPPLYEGLGAIEHKVTTASPLAQQYFNQGLRLLFAFNHDEAVRGVSFSARRSHRSRLCDGAVGHRARARAELQPGR